jgi:hypothetical protein
MITGGFDSQRRPTVRAEMSSAQSANIIPVTFLIDTGAISTIVMPGDASKFQVDFNTLSAAPLLDIGGSSIPGFYINMFLDPLERGFIYTYNISDAIIVNPGLCNATHPSILGQTAWSRWVLHVGPTMVEIDPVRPDQKIP